MYLGSHLTPRNLKPVVNAIVGAVEELRQHVPREGDPRDDLLVHTAGSVAPVEHPLAAADELLERVLAQLANVGVEGPEERLRHGHPVLPGDPRRLLVQPQRQLEVGVGGGRLGGVVGHHAAVQVDPGAVVVEGALHQVRQADLRLVRLAGPVCHLTVVQRQQKSVDRLADLPVRTANAAPDW